MAQFKHSRLSKLARMRYWGTSRKGLVTSAAGDSRLRGQRKGPTHTHTYTHTHRKRGKQKITSAKYEIQKKKKGMRFGLGSS